MEIRMDTSQKTTLSQRMIQSVEILQMDALMLDSYIKKIEMENPVIEFRDSMKDSNTSLKSRLERVNSYHKNNGYNSTYDSEEHSDYINSIAIVNTSLEEYLISQVIALDIPDQKRKILYYMINSLDSRGYFHDDIEDIMNRFNIKKNDVYYLLKLIQSLEPAGVGARNLEECLIEQLKREKCEDEIVYTLVKDYLTPLSNNRFKDIAKSLHVSEEQIIKSRNIIKKLNPIPANGFSSEQSLAYIHPDIIVIKNRNNEFLIEINEGFNFRITINPYYRKFLEETHELHIKEYISKKIKQAEWIISCIEQRFDTLLKVTRAIVEYQKEFFCFGNGNLKPMKLVDIADIIDMHISTVSRAVKDKYLECIWGVYPLKYFFNQGISNDKIEVVPEKVKELILSIILSEDKSKPYSDQKISELLSDRQLPIARRTVAKYRNEMGIDTANNRKHKPLKS